MDLDNNIKDCPLVFFDLETTGLLPESSYICEIAALRVVGGKAIDKFSTLVRPRHKVPYASFCVHRISDNDLIGAPYFEDVAGELVNFLSGGILCAYNIAFDLGFVNYQLKKINRKALETPFIDILSMARSALNLKSYKLEAVANFFGLASGSQFHRAENDARVACLIFFKLLEALKGEGSLPARKIISAYGDCFVY